MRLVYLSTNAHKTGSESNLYHMSDKNNKAELRKNDNSTYILYIFCNFILMELYARNINFSDLEFS